MAESRRRMDLWRVPTLVLWLVFLVVGLVPEYWFHLLRDLALVSTQRALVNSPFAITLAFAGYLAVFGTLRARGSGLPEGEVHGRGVQIGIIGLVAFLPGVFDPFLNITDISPAYLRKVVYLLATAKIGAWLYVLVLLFRYYALGNVRVFAGMFSVFPSSHREVAGKPETPPRLPPGKDAPRCSEAQDERTKR